MKVFVGGSRKIVHLSDEVKSRLMNIVDVNGAILIGDANGADRSVQQFLDQINYRNVTVYYVGVAPRNNVGHWATRSVESIAKKKDFSFFVLKDIAMSKAADYGFMLWDGKSKGTINNAVNLLRENKKLLLFHSAKNQFFYLKEFSHLRKLMLEPNTLERERLIIDLKIKELYNDLPQKSLSFS